jgi:hypothetical protein
MVRVMLSGYPVEDEFTVWIHVSMGIEVVGSIVMHTTGMLQLRIMYVACLKAQTALFKTNSIPFLSVILPIILYCNCHKSLFFFSDKYKAHK